MIEISHLSKRYGNHYAVNDISFTAEPGKIYGFLGPNGAGKSTTMNIITGYLGATEGTVTVNGKDILKNPEDAKAQIGYLPEIPPLYVDMTVEEYLDFSAELKKIKKSIRMSQIQEIMELTKIVNVKDRLIKNLSKGYKQRVGLACALLGYPEVIILDEPSVGLDPEQIIEMRQLIKSLKENHTVILSSHILTEVQEVCDYVFIINKGQLVASDNLEDMVGRDSTINITVKGDKNKAIKTVSELQYVEEVEAEESDISGCVDLSVFVEEKQDIRAEISVALIKADLPILEMTMSEYTLEDVFLEVTSEESLENEHPEINIPDYLSEKITDEDDEEDED